MDRSSKRADICTCASCQRDQSQPGTQVAARPFSQRPDRAPHPASLCRRFLKNGAWLGNGPRHQASPVATRVDNRSSVTLHEFDKQCQKYGGKAYHYLVCQSSGPIETIEPR